MAAMPTVPKSHFFCLPFAVMYGLRSSVPGDRPCVRMPHPVTIDQKAVEQIHNGQDDEQLPEARRKAERTVYPIDTDQHITDIAGNADSFEQQAVAPVRSGLINPSFTHRSCTSGL